MNWSAMSVVGWIILIIAFTVAAYKLGMQPIWIVIGALALLGITIIASVRHSKPRF